MTARTPTAAEVAFELMFDGGTGHEAYDRLTAPAIRDSAIAVPPASPVWIMTADGWRAISPNISESRGSRQ